MKMNDTVDGDDVDMLKAERNGNGYKYKLYRLLKRIHV